MKINRFVISATIFLSGAIFIGSQATFLDASNKVSFETVLEAAPPDSSFELVEIACGTAMAYGESRNQPDVGQRGVLEVALNRVDSQYYPNSLCEVVFQDKQFSFFNPSDPNRGKTFSALMKNTSDEALIRSRRIAIETYYRPREERIMKGLHYLEKNAKPFWRKSMPTEGRVTVDDHIFFASKRP